MTTAGHQLQKLTECSICLKTFTDPRILPCIHTFCLGCLKQTAYTRDNDPGENLHCPLCREMFDIPADGLDGLQKNFFIEHLMEITTNLQQSKTSAIDCDICKYICEGDENTGTATMRCLECRDSFCEFCAKAHKLQIFSKDHHVVKIGSETEEDVRRMSPNRNCSYHIQKTLDYYCPKCKIIVCVSCVLEKHVSHECKDVSTVEQEFRQVIERNAFKISIYADEMIGKRNNVEKRKENILLKMAETESKIRQRNLQLKEEIDQDTYFLLEELSRIKRDQIKDCENEKEEIDRSYTILKSFETYCTELTSEGSASDICSLVDKLLTRANVLEDDHEAFIGRPCQSTEIYFKPTVLQRLLNTVGKIQEDSSEFENCMVIGGLYDGQNLMNDIFRINLHFPSDISTEQQLPSTMQNGAAAAVYRNTMYVTGIGVNYDEIWKYDLISGWMKCASLVKCRVRHCVAFVDEVLYICGGYVVSDHNILDSVEGYNPITNRCTTVGKLVHGVQSTGNCVPYKSSIYIFGGTDKYREFNHVQVYNTKQNVCTLLSKPMPGAYGLLRAALWKTSVILVGCHTCLIFNLETEDWQERKQFKTDVDHFGLALANDRIFVIGGGTSQMDDLGNVTWKCRDDVRYVPVCCVLYDKPFEWNIYANMSRPALVQTYEKITIEFLGSGNESDNFIQKYNTHKRSPQGET